MSEEPGPREDDAALDATPGTAAWAALAESRERFLRFVERRVGRRDVAEDLVQTAFAKGLGRAAAGETPAAAWLFATLRNAIIDHYRRRAATERRTAAADLDALPAPDAAELQETVCACVARLATTLKPEYAEALREVEIEGRPVKDYATRAAVTPANAGMRLSRARHALRRLVLRSCGLCAEHGCRDCSCGGA